MNQPPVTYRSAMLNAAIPLHCQTVLRLCSEQQRTAIALPCEAMLCLASALISGALRGLCNDMRRFAGPLLIRI
jgi:hypothetical protein